MITFDVSASMAATDLPPTRMEAAQAIARTSSSSSRRASSSASSRSATPASRSTHRPATRPTSSRRSTGSTPSRGTSRRAGADRDARRHREGQGRHARRTTTATARPTRRPRRRRCRPGSDASTVIVLLSDGENTERPDPIEAAQQAADLGIRIVTIGVASAAGADLDLDGFKVHTAARRGDRCSRSPTSPRARTTPPTTRTGSTPSTATSQPRLVVRSEPLEITSLLAALGLVAARHRRRALAGVGREAAVTFLWIGLLALVLVVPVLIAIYLWSQRRRRRRRALLEPVADPGGAARRLAAAAPPAVRAVRRGRSRRW